MYEGMAEYEFVGSHAIKVDQLREVGIFPTYVSILAVAPIVGYEYGRRAKKDNSSTAPKSVFLEQLQKMDSRFEMNYKTMMLLDSNHIPEPNERFRRAFQVSPENRSEEDLEWYESYVRGGVDFLHEKIIGDGNTQDERLYELYELVDSFSERYGIA